MMKIENILKFKKKLLEVDWNQMYDIDYVNHCYDKFLSIFSTLYNECFPLIKKKLAQKSNLRSHGWQIDYWNLSIQNTGYTCIDFLLSILIRQRKIS